MLRAKKVFSFWLCNIGLIFYSYGSKEALNAFGAPPAVCVRPLTTAARHVQRLKATDVVKERVT